MTWLNWTYTNLPSVLIAASIALGAIGKSLPPSWTAAQLALRISIDIIGAVEIVIEALKKQFGPKDPPEPPPPAVQSAQAESDIDVLRGALRKPIPKAIPALVALCLCSLGCAWLQKLEKNPVVEVQSAESFANLAVSALVDEWNTAIKPTLSLDDANAFQALLDNMIVKFRAAEAAALDAAQIAADGQANNWPKLIQDIISTTGDVVRLFDAMKAAHKLPQSHAQAFAHGRLAAMRAR